MKAEYYVLFKDKNGHEKHVISVGGSRMFARVIAMDCLNSGQIRYKGTTAYIYDHGTIHVGKDVARAKLVSIVEKRSTGFYEIKGSVRRINKNGTLRTPKKIAHPFGL